MGCQSRIAHMTSCLCLRADWVVGDTVAPNYFASTLETISGDDQLGLIEPRIHLTAIKPDEKNGPDLNAIFVKVRTCPPGCTALDGDTAATRGCPTGTPGRGAKPRRPMPGCPQVSCPHRCWRLQH